ncbi:MAG: N-acetylmuramoyl-L-alanine amidase [Lachnospiraceae bacterium]|nr:N-acetylmuramoyl-L-alanine amidase [Lachnospiraceae bacterium]
MKNYGLLILTIAATLVCMPVMLFLFTHNDVYAGGMILEDAKTDDESSAVKTTLDTESNIQIVDGIDEGDEISLGIPLNYDTDADAIIVQEDKVESVISIYIPTEDDKYYYRNELTGSQKGIASVEYDYKDGAAGFEIVTDGYYIATVHMTQRELYLELVSPKELYGHVFVIDAPHGGDDNGNSAYGVKEKDVSLRIARAIADKAEETGVGGFYLVRGTDEPVSEEDRERLISLLDPDYYICIHVDADGDTRVTNGIRAVVDDPQDEKSVRKLVSVMASKTGQKDLGVTAEIPEEGSRGHMIDLYTGYITNKSEALQIGSDEYSSSAGDVIYAWLMYEEEGE